MYLSRYTIFLGNETAELDEMYQKYLRAQEKYQKEFWCPKVDCGIEGINELCPETCTSGKKRDIYCRLYCYRRYKIHSSPKNRSNTKYVIIIYFQLFAKLKTIMGHVYSPLITRTNSITDAQEQMKMADIHLTHHGVPSK